MLTDVLGLGLDWLDPDQVTRILSVHPRAISRTSSCTYVDGLKHRPETTNGTVNADVLEHFVPGFRRTTTVERVVGSAWRAERDRREETTMSGASRFTSGRRLGRATSFGLLVLANVLYVAGFVRALLTAGSLSDHIGRRPVLVLSLLVAAGTAIFWTADGVAWLVIARVVQGIATGMTTGALAAGLVEFSPAGRPRGISAATTATSRSETFSTAYMVSYAALSIPSLATTGYMYIAFVGVSSLCAARYATRKGT
ncbi:MAG TPA: MFS transporter [Pseudonocardiaceae bacterium]|nr:MFS transporter [Pseudonocardiaceae bacterium]